MQRKTISLLEQVFNTTLGLVLSFFILKLIISPIWGLDTNIHDEYSISILFYIMSIIRGFFWRRFFNRFGLQSHLQTTIEQLLNVGSGVLINFIFWSLVIVPLWNFNTEMNDNIMINVIFFICNYIRSYSIRRCFNYLTHRSMSKH